MELFEPIPPPVGNAFEARVWIDVKWKENAAAEEAAKSVVTLVQQTGEVPNGFAKEIV